MDEKYFESVARGDKGNFEVEPQETEEVSEITEPTTATDAVAHEMGNYEVELANAVASRSGTKMKNGHSGTPKSAGWEDTEPEGQLTLDVYQTPDYIVVESAVAGVRPEDLDINVTNDSISIKGVRHREEEVGDEDYLYRECYWGRFARSIILPQEVDPESAEVTFRNGILTVRLPKINKRKSKKLRVRLD